MTLRYTTTYQIKTGVNLGDPATWNVRFRDIDIRLNALEDTSKINDTINTLLQIGIDRIASTFDPLIAEAQTKVDELSGILGTLDGGTF